MKERDRILELVKQGVLSTEEALDLLESLATEKDEKQIEKVADELHIAEDAKVDQEEADAKKPLEDDEEAQAEMSDKEKADRKNLEKILDKLATEANKASAELDEVNFEIQGLRLEIKEEKEKLMELNTKEELDALSDEDLSLRSEIEGSIKSLEAELDKLNAERDELNESLKNIRKDQWNENKNSFNEKLKSVKIDIPDDWKEQATDTLNHVGKNVSEAGTHIGKFIKRTFQTVSDSVSDNVEWKDVNVRVPGIATSKFEHTFEFDATDATLIDVKVASGNLEFKTWDEPGVKVDAKIRLYGKMDAPTPLDAFNERSKIAVNDETISIQVPNKRVRADLEIYLPSRIYDHVSIKLLNGDIEMGETEVKDIYMKSTNGDITINGMDATMLELEGVNGNISINSGTILDLIVETVNGTVTVKGEPKNTGISLVNGDIRLTFAHDDFSKINANVVNGAVKLAVPVTAGMDGLVKTGLGSINSRMTDYEVVREKKEKMNQMLQFRRTSDSDMAKIDLSTTTGNIFLKDYAE